MINASNRQGSEFQRNTSVVYVCSPNYSYYVFNSIGSLLISKSHFDQLVIFCVGSVPSYWKFHDSRIKVIEVNMLHEEYFLVNKTYALTEKSERLIFIDADTFILRSMDSVYANCEKDFIGRPTSLIEEFPRVQDQWKEILNMFDSVDVPYFNSGFFIFQNASHIGIFDDWMKITGELYQNGIAERFHGNRLAAEQMALSLVIGKQRLSYELIDQKKHGYGWKSEPYDTVVYHTGSGLYRKHEAKIESMFKLYRLNIPRFKNFPNRYHLEKMTCLAKRKLRKLHVKS